jgi:hypothetical protein
VNSNNGKIGCEDAAIVVFAHLLFEESISAYLISAAALDVLKERHEQTQFI